MGRSVRGVQCVSLPDDPGRTNPAPANPANTPPPASPNRLRPRDRHDRRGRRGPRHRADRHDRRGFAYNTGMTPPPADGLPPAHEECVEQAYFFRTFRERLAENVPSQEILRTIHEDVLPSTRLPMAIEFLSSDMKHTGRLSTGFARLGHYFTPFQTFVVKQAEDDRQQLTMPVALLILEREAAYKAQSAGKETERAGLFVYQFETIARNRLGYDEGLTSVKGDPIYGPDWAAYVELVRRSAGVIDFCDLVYLRSAQHVVDERRKFPNYTPAVPPIFGDREGRIAKASRGREPLFLFAALQRQLNYPEVPRVKKRDDVDVKIEAQAAKLRELETRLRMVESELRGQFDPTQFGKPEAFRDVPEV